jgi:membrane protein DedA with SNARE-associated domain
VGLESAGLPVPGETALIAAAVLASQGHMQIAAVIALAAAGAIAGDNVGYLLGRRLGRRALLAGGPLLGRRRRLVEGGDRFFARHGGAAVFLGRFISIGRIAVAWLAGADRMPWPRFAIVNAAACAVWAVVVGLGAYLVGSAGTRWLGLALALAAMLALLHVARGLRRACRRPPAPAIPDVGRASQPARARTDQLNSQTGG